MHILRTYLAKSIRGIRNDSGMATAELAMIAPIFILFLVGSIDVGSAIHRNMQVQTAAHAGMQYVIARGYSSSGISSAIANATSATGITMPENPTQFCGCPTASGIATATCGTTCAIGGSAGTYARIKARGTYQTYFSYPAIPSSYVFTHETMVRVQ
jgi:Flp pilus assembly protein TadG